MSRSQGRVYNSGGDEVRETYPESGVYIAESADDVQQMLEWRDKEALLRVARAVQNRRMLDLTYDEIGEANKEIEEALKEVEHLL